MMAEQEDVDALLRELGITERLARVPTRPPRYYWCSGCQSWQIMETLEDGTRQCIVCRLRNELQLGESDGPQPTD